MYVHSRVLRSCLAVLAATGLITFRPSVGSAADDPPVPESNDQSRANGNPRKVANATLDAGESRVDSFGAFNDAIPIDVPAFRTITPALSLAYRSSNGNGWSGVGWQLDGVGRIERASPGKGAPRYDASDIFLLDGEELVPCAVGSVSPSCTSGGTHSTKTESYEKIALSGSGTTSTWTVTGKDGTKSVYGGVFWFPGADGQSGTADDTIFRWGLKQVVDTKNNVVTYTWSGNQFAGVWDYLDSISYNGTTVKFYYEQRTDIETAGIGGGLLERITGRIKTIDVKVASNRLRSYQLAYTTSGTTGRSLLASVRPFGKDAVLDASGTITGGTSLPAITAGYQAGTPTFTAGTATGALTYSSGAQYYSMDVNGDGKTDVVEIRPSGSSSNRKIWLGNGTGFTAGTADVMPYESGSRIYVMDINGDGKQDLLYTEPDVNNTMGRHIYLSNGTGFVLGTEDSAAQEPSSSFYVADVNGDGKSDLVYVEPDGNGISGRHIYLSDGTKFVLGTEDTMPVESGSKIFVADVNGDGKSDLVYIDPDATTYGRRIYLSNGTGFVTGAFDNVMPYDSGETGQTFLMADVNGDGLSDLIYLDTERFQSDGRQPATSRYVRRVYHSTGSSFVPASQDSVMPYAGSELGKVTFLAADVNGDGRSDLVYIEPGTTGTYIRHTYLSNGSGFGADTADSTLAYNSSWPSTFLLGDVNGDGLSDVVQIFRTAVGSAGVTARPSLIGGAFGDLLTSRTTGVGGTTTVSYKPSSAWSNTNGPPITQTASSVVVTDGRGGSSTTTYSYQGGAYDRSEQRSLGFAYQRETQPCIAGESVCPYTEIWFRQDYGAVGKVSRIDERDGSAKLLRAQLFTYTTNQATVPWTALQTARWDYTYVGTGVACPGVDCKRTNTASVYNAYGEVTREVDYGDSDVTGDETTTDYVFVPNTTAYLVDRPAYWTVYQGVGNGGTALNQRIFRYDGATSNNQAPSAGYPTAIYDWLSTSGGYVLNQRAYDAWGNVTTSIDEVGAQTITAYDPTYRLYPTSVTNALGQVVTSTWDPTCGVPTQSTNVNGQVTSITYDALCRIVQKTAPAGNFEKHTWVSLGDPAAQYEQIDEPSADGTAQARWSRRYFDGLGRTWRSAQKGPNAATGDIYVSTTYNARGAQASTTEPYYWVSGSPTTYTTTFGYDALDRPTRVTAPDGAQQNTTYGLWSTTTTDELGRAKTDRFDARGQRVAHDEIVGGATKTTTYAYDARQYLRQSVDPAGNTITYTTDSLGRMTTMVDPDWGTWTYEYDAAGRRTAHVDPKAQRTTFVYDALGRKKTKTSLAGTAQATTASWTYDESRAGFYNIGTLTTVSDGAGSRTFDYDAAARAVKTVRTIGGTSYTFQYGFDAGNRLLWTKYPDNDTAGTAAAPLLYDSAGRLVSIPGYVSAVTYAADGQATQINNANGTVTTRTLSPSRGWLTGIKTLFGATKIQDLVYTRNAKGMISQVQSPTANEAWSYAYDELDRLTTATNATSSTHNQTLAYDAIGNITSNSRRGAYAYGTRPHAVASAGASAYTYDGAGLMLTGPDRTLTWDGDNRLAAITSAGVTTTFTYDADGARIQAIEGATNRRYVGDDYEITNLSLVTKCISVGGVIVARKEGATTTWVHTDQLGSVQAQTNAAGVEAHRKLYRPYGEILSSTGSLEDEVGYTGQRQDASGLVYLHARYYDPSLGRFISPDFVIDGSDTDGLNRYAYVGNDPINAADPTGLARTAGIRAAQNVSKAGGDVNVNRPSGLGYVKRTPGATRTTQIRSERTSGGGTRLTTQHGSSYFAPRSTARAAAPSAGGVGGVYAASGAVATATATATLSAAVSPLPVAAPPMSIYCPNCVTAQDYLAYAAALPPMSADYRSLNYNAQFAAAAAGIFAPVAPPAVCNQPPVVQLNAMGKGAVGILGAMFVVSSFGGGRAAPGSPYSPQGSGYAKSIADPVMAAHSGR